MFCHQKITVCIILLLDPQSWLTIQFMGFSWCLTDYPLSTTFDRSTKTLTAEQYNSLALLTGFKVEFNINIFSQPAQTQGQDRVWMLSESEKQSDSEEWSTQTLYWLYVSQIRLWQIQYFKMFFKVQYRKITFFASRMGIFKDFNYENKENMSIHCWTTVIIQPSQQNVTLTCYVSANHKYA